MIVNNNLLFSHTYLARLQADPSHDEAAAPIAQGLHDWMPFRDTSSLQSLIDSWVGPVLDFLKFHHAPADDAPHLRLLYARRGDETPIGLCYVVPPGQDGSTGSPHGLDDTTKGQHPMAQAVLALRTRDLRWGMLTDGARWRLVDAQALRRYEHYVEVDLNELARSDDPTPLRLFYAIFHCSAFTSAHPPASGGTEGGGESGLDRLVAASIRATKAAEDHLKALVSHNEGIMAQLCLGLVRANGRTHYTEAERDVIYRDATYLLYRILFILYAEARGLLPLDNPAYRTVSLAELVKTAHDYKLHGMPDPQATTLWERLKRLCNAIYESDPTLGIPAYNGGLFDDADKPYLRDGHIADAYLTEALFDLAYMPGKVTGTSEVPVTFGHRPIDYRDLSVRHLGSLYEGMIEYKLHIAEETLWARRDSKGNLRFLRQDQEGAPRKTDEEIKQGSVYFSQSPGERRATGTYYTPEYIVDYIVSQTVWRGLEERRASLEEKLHGWLEEIQTSEVSETSEVLPMQRTADEELKRFVEEQVLTFRVCDPAMGSGHFLVNAAHQITNFIVETLHLTPWANKAADTDPVAWRRRVVERCLYGVDLSLMAVELAKLSLWLASVAEGKPLSFLDHHLRQGNSLIGARLEDLAEVLAETVPTAPSRQERKAREAGQLSMLDDPAFSQHVTTATDLLAQISARVVERVEDVKAQEADYEQVRTELEPYRRLADLWTARHFGVDVDEQQLRAISRYLVNGAVSRMPEYERILTRTQELTHERSFFHWELEFPEVFLGQRGRLLENQSGFDAIVGNPPYGAALSKEERNYVELVFPQSKPNKNTAMLFMELAHQISFSRWSMILPKSLAFAQVWRDGRNMINPTLEIAVDMSQAFEEVLLEQMIVVCSDQQEVSHYQSPNVREDGIVERGPALSKELVNSTDAILLGLNSCELYILNKILQRSRPLNEISSTFRGLPAQRYLQNREGQAIIGGAHIGRYVIRESQYFLDVSQSRLETKARKLLQPKIVSQRIVAHVTNPFERIIIMSAVEPGSLLTVDTVENTLLKDSRFSLESICAMLNARLFSWYAYLFIFAKAIRTMDLDSYYIGKLPLYRFSFLTDGPKRERLLSLLAALYAEDLDNGVFTQLLSEVDRLFEHSDVIHDLLGYLAEQMTEAHKHRQRLERQSDLFRFVKRDIPCLPLDKALSGPLDAGKMVGDLSAIHHDIEGLRLSQEEDGRWLLEVRAKLRDPESGWREHQRDKDGKFIRQWLPAYRLPLDKATGRFYHYAFAHLGGFDSAGKFPGGYTRTTLEKLKATKVPKFVPVDLAPLAALGVELAEVRRKIQLTDDLIDQIVYKLYGLTEEEIAIVEGRA